MPTFIPPAPLDDTQRPESEKFVYESLKGHLDSSWYVFPNFHYLFQDNQKRLWDKEVDFLLYRPGMGILILEVKGGLISYRDSTWFQEDRAIQPISQARLNKYAIMDLLEKKFGHPVHLRFAHCVCFPSLQAEGQVWPPEADGLVLYRDTLKFLPRIAEDLLSRAPLPPDVERMPPPLPEEVIQILSPRNQPAPRLCDMILDDGPRFCKLTDEQDAILKALQEFPRLQVEGPAGTGKTYLAMRKAERVYDEGGTPIILCYNQMIAHKIQKRLRDERYNIQVYAFFDFCVKAANIPRQEYEKYKDNPLLYSKVLIPMLNQSLDKNPLAYDCVIIDEGQDFSRPMLDAAQRLLSPGGHFYIFYDPGQNIFRNQMLLPLDTMGTPPVYLTRNCRNTLKIIQALQAYHRTDMTPMPQTPTGKGVTLRQDGEMRNMLEQELETLFAKDQISHTQVVVLGAHSLSHTSLGDNPHAGRFTLMENAKSTANGEIAYYTYMKFKGCEANAVILLDVDPDDPRWNVAGLYTAMSRAIHKLIILQPPDAKPLPPPQTTMIL